MGQKSSSTAGTKSNQASHGSAAPGGTSGSPPLGPNVGQGSTETFGNEDSERRRQSSGKANEGPQTEILETIFNDASSLDLGYEPQDAPDKPSPVPYTDRVQHDLGHLMYHRHLEDFGMQLQKAAEATMITDRKSNYARVSVLLLHWENESFDIIQRVYDLGHLLSKHYDFGVERWAIPIGKKSHQEVYRKMYGLVEDDNQMHLRIVFYTGPACLSEQGELVWMARGGDSHQSRPSRVRWPAIQSLLEEAPVDVLILLDCCRTGTSSLDGGNGVTSLIAACSFNTVACGMSQHSFIEVLIRQLKIMRSLPCFSSAYLYSRIYQDIQTQIKSSEYTPRELPVHLVLSQDPAYPRDILLSANHHKDTFRRDHRSDQASDSSEKCLSRCPSPTRKGWPDDGDADHLPVSQETMPSRYPRLLLSFRLLEDMDPEALRIDLFSHWLGSLPIPVDSVKVEAGFSSDSTVLLVSVPVAMLPFLPRDPSVTIIGTIGSSNLMASTPWGVEGQDLALKDHYLPVVYIENPHEMSDRMSSAHFLLKTYQMIQNSTVAHAEPNSWDVQYSRSVCAGRLPTQPSSALEGCEVSSDGKRVVYWSKTKLMVFSSRLPHADNDHDFTMTGQFQLNPEFERSWVTVKIGTRYLIASTSAQLFNCYIFDLDVGKYIYGDFGVWDRVDLPWPKVHKVAISPDEQTVAFISGLTGGEKGIQGSQVYCLPLPTFIRMGTSVVGSVPNPCLYLQDPIDEVEDLTLNDLGDGYVVIRSKSADGSSARAAVFSYSRFLYNPSGVVRPLAQQEVQHSDHFVILPGTPGNDTRIIVAQNELLLTARIRGASTEHHITFSRSGFVDDDILGVVGHYGDAILTVETRNSKFGSTSHLMAYRKEAQRNSCRLELTELLPSLENSSELAMTIVEEDLLVLAATIGQFRFAVYKIRLPKSLSTETVPRLIAHPKRERDADALHALGLGEPNEQQTDMPEGAGSDWNEDMSSTGSESLYDSLLSEDEHCAGNQDE